MRILLCDDDDCQLHFLESILVPLDHHVHSTSHGDEAWLSYQSYVTRNGSVYKTKGSQNPRIGTATKGSGGGVTPGGWHRKCQLANHYLNTFKPRITAWDWKRVLAHCVPTDMVYLDVPYYGRDTTAYQPLPEGDYEELIRLLLRAPHKWILSEYQHPIYQPLTDKFGPPVEIEVFKHGSPLVNGERPKAVECLWSNYDIRGMLCPEGMMDINHMIEQLEQKKRDIDVTIRTLRQEAGIKANIPVPTASKKASTTSPKPKGRVWSDAKRAEMSRKLKASWAKRKKGSVLK